MFLLIPGGRNGYGAKLCNIFSKKFTVETGCREYKKLFKQVGVLFFPGSLYLRFSNETLIFCFKTLGTPCSQFTVITVNLSHKI